MVERVTLHLQRQGPGQYWYWINHTERDPVDGGAKTLGAIRPRAFVDLKSALMQAGADIALITADALWEREQLRLPLDTEREK